MHKSTIVVFNKFELSTGILTQKVWPKPSTPVFFISCPLENSNPKEERKWTTSPLVTIFCIFIFSLMCKIGGKATIF
jgi:hypothetical protein